MKKILSIIACMLICLNMQAGDKVKYRSQGMLFSYTILLQDNQKYIVVSMETGQQAFVQPPILMFKTFEDDVIKMEGTVVDDKNSNGGVMVSGIFVPISVRTFIAQFKISDEEVELLRKGIKKVRLTTLPKQHEKVFSKDKLGVKLYNMFVNAQEKQNDF